MVPMRVSIDIDEDDDAYRQIKQFAQEQEVGMPKAYALLLKEGLDHTGYHTVERTTERTDDVDAEGHNFDFGGIDED